MPTKRRDPVKDLINVYGSGPDALREITEQIANVDADREDLVRKQHALIRAMIADPDCKLSLRDLGGIARMSHQNVALIRDAG